MPSKTLHIVRAWMVIGAFIAIVSFLLTHEPLPAIPNVVPPSLLAYDKADYRLASAEAVKDVVGLMITIAFGLAAVVGFAIRGGLGSSCLIQLVNLMGVCIFAYMITRVFVLGYDCYAAVATQLDRGYFFLTRLEAAVLLQAKSLVLSAVVALALFFVGLLPKREH